MRPLQFNISKSEGLNEYHLGATADKWLDKTIISTNWEFYETLLDKYETQESQYHKLLYNLAYYNCTHEENIFIYEQLIWSLIKNKNVYVTINFLTATFLTVNDLPFDIVNWEYEIEYEANLDYTDVTFRDKGFVPAKTGWIEPATPRWNNDDKDKTAVFKIDSFETFIRMILACVMDDCSSINFYCIEERNRDKLINSLNGNKKPKLSDILENDDFFITLFLGADEGFQDYLLLKSKSDLTNDLHKITNTVNEGCELYETELQNVNTFEQLTDLIERSFGLKIHSS